MTDKKTMNEMNSARFAALIEAYGAELARWPEAERLAAHDYARKNPGTARLMSEARALDSLLAATAVSVPEGLAGKVLAQCAVRQHSPWTLGALQVMPTFKGALEAVWPGSALWKPASVFASALLMGAVLALNVSLPAASESAGNDDVLALAAPVLAQDVAIP